MVVKSVLVNARGTVKAALPAEYTEIAKHKYRDALRPVLSRRHSGTSRYCPVCENHVAAFLSAGVVPRPDARCPICGSLERHRLLWRYLAEETTLLSPGRKQLLHIAPEYVIARRLREIPGLDYLSADLNSRMVMVKMDITDIQYPPASFDIILCNHVMEHIPDDARALSELYRVLKPGGWAIVQVPIKGSETIEDTAALSPAERLERFGQRDHVRIYGRDYRDRLTRAGFAVTVDDYAQRMDEEQATLIGIDRTEEIYLCAKEL